MHYGEFHPLPIRERAQEAFEAQLENIGPHQPIETSLLTSDDKEVPVELLAQIIQVDGVPVLMGTFRDVTQRRHAEEALRQSEERYRFIAENSPDIITIINPDNSFRYISPAAEQILGYTPDEVVEHMGFDHVHPEDRAPTLAAYARLVEDPDYLLNVRYRLRRKDGSYRFVEAAGRNGLANPATRAIFLNVRDITARMQLEEQLRSSEERYRQLVQNSSDFTATFNSEGKIDYVSPAVERMLGYKPEELDGQARVDLFHPEDLPRVLDASPWLT
jgi:PAS domain S-box-containing protein